MNFEKIKEFLKSKGFEVKTIKAQGAMLYVNNKTFGLYEPREGIYRFGGLMEGSEVCKEVAK